ncbi:hypothetical protein ABK040_012666 [Willaertia magna]
MYNGIGLTTPRGTGTNGHVQRNYSDIPYHKKQQNKQNKISQELNKIKAPNPEILLHEQKRQIEMDLMKLKSKLKKENKLSETEIESLIKEERINRMKNLEEKSNVNNKLESNKNNSIINNNDDNNNENESNEKVNVESSSASPSSHHSSHHRKSSRTTTRYKEKNALDLMEEYKLNKKGNVPEHVRLEAQRLKNEKAKRALGLGSKTDEEILKSIQLKKEEQLEKKRKKDEEDKKKKKKKLKNEEEESSDSDSSSDSSDSSDSEASDSEYSSSDSEKDD